MSLCPKVENQSEFKDAYNIGKLRVLFQHCWEVARFDDPPFPSLFYFTAAGRQIKNAPSLT